MAPTPPTSSPEPATVQADLDKTYLAATRTLFALLRTGSVIAGGGALATSLLVKGWPRWVVVLLSSGFVLLGYWMMWSALKKGRQLRARLALSGRETLFADWQFALMTIALQLLILAVVVLYLVSH
ncbi:MAG: hypothetical protein QM765_01050 [Myxococcales bacterium]